MDSRSKVTSLTIDDTNIFFITQVFRIKELRQNKVVRRSNKLFSPDALLARLASDLIKDINFKLPVLDQNEIKNYFTLKKYVSELYEKFPYPTAILYLSCAAYLLSQKNPPDKIINHLSAALHLHEKFLAIANQYGGWAQAAFKKTSEEAKKSIHEEFKQTIESIFPKKESATNWPKLGAITALGIFTLGCVYKCSREYSHTARKILC